MSFVNRYGVPMSVKPQACANCVSAWSVEKIRTTARYRVNGQLRILPITDAHGVEPTSRRDLL